jgi:hypothetical protein
MSSVLFTRLLCWIDYYYKFWPRMHVESTHMDVIVFFKQPQLCACSLGLCLYCNKVVQHATCENHTHECENQMQRAKITLVRVLLPLVSKVDWFWTFSWTSNSLNSLKFESGPNRGNPKDFKNWTLCTALLPYRAACRFNMHTCRFIRHACSKYIVSIWLIIFLDNQFNTVA